MRKYWPYALIALGLTLVIVKMTSAGYYGRTGVSTVASARIDSFARTRVSNPETLFDSKQLHDALPLIWDDSETSGGGTASTYSSNTASTEMTVSAATAGRRVRQTRMRFNYQPGKSQLVFLTVVLDDTGGGTGITRGVGIYDDDNGLFFRDAEGEVQVVQRSNTTGSPVDTFVAQAAWNIDRMDGAGPSGIEIDWKKAQILLIDYEWLGVGRVRYAVVTGGVPLYVHEFLNANQTEVVYMSTPNLPIRYEIQNDGTGVASGLQHICSSVISEGGKQSDGVLRYASTDGVHVDANVPNALYAVIGIRLRNGYEGCVVDRLIVSLLTETNDDFEWVLMLNPTVTGTFSYADVPDSCAQAATGSTANTVSAGVAITGGWISSGAAISDEIRNALRLGAAIDGTADEMVLCARPLSSNADIQGSLTWREMQ